MKVSVVVAVILVGLGAAWLAWKPAGKQPVPAERLPDEASSEDSPTHVLQTPTIVVARSEQTSSEGAVARATAAPQPTVLPRTSDLPAYYRLGVDALSIHLEILRESLYAEATPLLWAQVQAGKAERIAEPGAFTYQSRPEDRVEIHGIMNDVERGVFRASLSREQFADLYEVKDQIDLVEQVIKEKQKAGDR